MPGNSNMFTMQIFLLCLVLVGVITVKTRLVDEHTRSSFSNLVLSLFLPCNILSSFIGSERSQFHSMQIIFFISIGIMVLCFFLSKYVLYRRVGAEQKKVLLYATLISNASFIGNPLVESVFGTEALVYASAYLIPLRIALWTVGLAVFAGGKGNIRKVIFHPCLIATYAGIALMLSGFTPPALVSRLVFSLGNCTTPLSMMVVGNVLALADPRKLVSKITVYFTFIRLILIPFLVMAILLVINRWLKMDPVIPGIAVILSGMPGAVTTSMLADKYNADKELSSNIIFVSTVLSMVSIPLLLWLLQKVI